MEKTEKLVPLSAEEFEKLKEGKTGCTGCFVIVIVLTALTSALLFFFLSDGFRHLFSPPALIVPLLAAGLLALAYFIRRRDKIRTDHDLRAGRKRVVTAEVINQFIQSSEGTRHSNHAVTMTYVVNIGGKQYKVSEEDYYKYREGMRVEVHTAPHSEIFFGIYDASDGKLLTAELA
jgi:hypothetical protein